MIKSWGILILILTSQFAHGVNVSTSDVTNQAQAKKWHILFDMNHQPATRDEQFTTTDFTLFFDYQINASNSLRILQAPTKNYDIALGQNEWVASDTILSHFWNTPWSIAATGTRFRWVSVLNLPTSIESQDFDRIVTVGGTLQANTMIAGKLLVSLRPFFRYNWNEFKTSQSGRPLPMYLVGLTMLNSYNVNDNLSLNATVSYSVIYDSASQYDESTQFFGQVDDQSSGRYSIDLSANYSWTDKFGTYLGYSQGDNYIVDGRFQMYAYDPRFTRYSMGLTFYF